MVSGGSDLWAAIVRNGKKGVNNREQQQQQKRQRKQKKPYQPLAVCGSNV